LKQIRFHHNTWYFHLSRHGFWSQNISSLIPIGYDLCLSWSLPPHLSLYWMTLRSNQTSVLNTSNTFSSSFKGVESTIFSWTPSSMSFGSLMDVYWFSSFPNRESWWIPWKYRISVSFLLQNICANWKVYKKKPTFVMLRPWLWHMCKWILMTFMWGNPLNMGWLRSIDAGASLHIINAPTNHHI